MFLLKGTVFSLILNKTGHNGDNQAIDVENQQGKEQREKKVVSDTKDLRDHHSKSIFYEKDEIRREQKLWRSKNTEKSYPVEN